MKIEAVNYNGKQVGNILADLVYVSHRKFSKHLFRGGKPTVKAAIKAGTAMWGISHDLLKLLKDAKVKVVAIEAEGTVYWASLERFVRTSSFLEMDNQGLQKFMKLNEWNVYLSINELVEAVVATYRREAA